MSSGRSFDRLAAAYRTLELLAFGHDLERARFAYLERLQACRSILVAGEGDGRCLARLVRAAPAARIDCLDSSGAMLDRARARLAESEAADRVSFRQVDLLAAELPAETYEAAVTFFFLDCFTEAQAAAVMARIDASLRPEAQWLWADFALPPAGFARFRARVWVAILYAFFRLQTGLRARRLPPAEAWLAAHGYRAAATSSWQQGLVRSVAWERVAKTR